MHVCNEDWDHCRRHAGGGGSGLQTLNVSVPQSKSKIVKAKALKYFMPDS